MVMPDPKRPGLQMKKVCPKTNRKPKNGLMAEWLGKGLQNLVQRFESASDLKKRASNQLI